MKIKRNISKKIEFLCKKYPFLLKIHVLNEISRICAEEFQESEERIREIYRPKFDTFEIKSKTISIAFQCEEIDIVAGRILKRIKTDKAKNIFNEFKTRSSSQSLHWALIGYLATDKRRLFPMDTMFADFPHSDIIQFIELKINRVIPMLYSISFTLHFDKMINEKIASLDVNRNEFTIEINTRHRFVHTASVVYNHTGRKDKVDIFLDRISRDILEYFDLKKSLGSTSIPAKSEVDAYRYEGESLTVKDQRTVNEWLRFFWFDTQNLEILSNGVILSQENNKFSIAHNALSDKWSGTRNESIGSIISLYSFFWKIRENVDVSSNEWRKLFEKYAHRSIMPPKPLLLGTTLLVTKLKRLQSEVSQYQSLLVNRFQFGATVDHLGSQIDIVDRDTQYLNEQISELNDRVSDLESSIKRFIETRTLYLAARIQNMVLFFTLASVLLVYTQIHLSLEQQHNIIPECFKITPIIQKNLLLISNILRRYL